ncbi:MAG: alpha-rhamnosidase [Verrucomicrobia bacterium]|nr:MAG: alpha-rhamnosidase [Verrucomicrobiota bacterium]
MKINSCAVVVLLGMATAMSARAGLKVGQMLCEYQENPIGVDVTRPELTWKLTSNQRAMRQNAYQILVASTREKLADDCGDLWDSGKVNSDATAHIAYAGKPLVARQLCFWKVRVWDQAGAPSKWSAVATWELGLLDLAQWGAKWIGQTTNVALEPLPLFRREFTVTGKVRAARLYLAGLGYHEARLNGEKVGDHHLDPAYTRYDKRVLYVTHDVTAQLHKGVNALGVMLGHGWFNVQTKAAWNFDEAPWRATPRLLASLQIDYADGHTEIIGTDEKWKCASGPVQFNTIYGGELYDARKEQAGWDAAGFADRAWEAAKLVAAPQGKLVAQALPPIRADQVLKVVKITEPKPGVFVFDFGQNMAGYAELKVRGPAGTAVKLKYAERLAADGGVDQKIIAEHVIRFGSNQVFQTDTYVLKGQGKETWHSRFAYYGFQYVEVTGFPGKPTRDSLRAVFAHTAVPVAGRFECSNELLNKIWEAGRWSYLSNLQGIPTDCPHREKNGWTGDAHLAAEQAMFNYFPPAVYVKWLNDLGDEQQPDGRLPGIVPTAGWGYKWGNGPAWDNAFMLIPYYQYVYYGDTAVLRQHYTGMKRYVDYLATRATNGIVNIGLNDWAPWKTKTGAAITDTAYFYVDARIVALAAQLLGKQDEAAQYNALAESIRTAFNARFYRADTGLYDNGSQTALSCALYQGLVPPEHHARVLGNLVAAVEKTGGHIDAGILGAKYLLNALLENGCADVAYRIVAQKDQPGWVWWISQGATTLWEEWNGDASRNHIMFGDVSAWFYKALAGIVPDPQAPGFRHFFIKPNVVGDLTSARADYDSISGRIVSDWKLRDGEFRLHVMIPANTSATITLPTSDLAAAKGAGISKARLENGRVVCEAGSGAYDFRCPLRMSSMH